MLDEEMQKNCRSRKLIADAKQEQCATLTSLTPPSQEGHLSYNLL